MRRFLLSTIAILALGVAGSGCQNFRRIGCECKDFYADVQKTIFGIDQPNGIPDSARQKYFGLNPPGPQPLCDI